MDTQTTLALYAQGRDAWNAWAEDMRARRPAPEQRVAARTWAAEARADFCGHAFAAADFTGFSFPGGVVFAGATVGDTAWFAGARFEGGALFAGARFEGGAWFDAATFRRPTGFWNARFEGVEADFVAIHAESAFSLKDATFKAVPDFTQAHFAEAPRLDDLRVPSPPGLFSPPAADPELSARYRALKRLAVQGHDHGKEQEFFAAELTSLRGNPDRLLPDLSPRPPVRVERWRREEEIVAGRRPPGGHLPRPGMEGMEMTSRPMWALVDATVRATVRRGPWRTGVRGLVSVVGTPAPKAVAGRTIGSFRYDRANEPWVLPLGDGCRDRHRPT